jgi:hypothetical protein
MTENGQTPERPKIDARLLTPRDMARAKVALAEVLDGRSPYDMVEGEVDDAVPFTIWCLKSRANPAFTWEEALDTPFLGDFEPVSPPPIPPPDASGSSPGKNGGSKPKAKPAAPDPARSSASTSG